MILLTKRQEYDISKIARHITEDQLSPNEKKSYIESEWNHSDLHCLHFGIKNNHAFRKQIDIELDKLDYPEEYETPLISPITEKKTFQIQNLTLRDIRKKYPVLGEKLRVIIFTKYTDVDGYYYSALKNRLCTL